MGDEDAAVGVIGEGILARSITELSAGLTAKWAFDFGAVTKLICAL